MTKIKKGETQPKRRVRGKKLPPFFAYSPGTVFLKSGVLVFGPLPAYRVPDELMAKSSQTASKAQRFGDESTLRSETGDMPVDTLNIAQGILDRLAELQRSPVSVPRRGDSAVAPPSDINEVSSDDVSRYLAEKGLLQLAEATIDYFSKKARELDIQACETLAELAERAVKGFNDVPADSVKKAVARKREYLPVLVGSHPTEGSQLLKWVWDLGIGADVQPRVRVNRVGAPYSKDTEINKLAGSLITYMHEIRKRRPSFSTTKPKEIAELPAQLTKAIWALPELNSAHSKWCDVGEKLILNSGLSLADIPGLAWLGVHRKKHNTAGRRQDKPIGLKGNVADAIRRALRQAFRTLAKKPD